MNCTVMEGSTGQPLLSLTARRAKSNPDNPMMSSKNRHYCQGERGAGERGRRTPTDSKDSVVELLSEQATAKQYGMTRKGQMLLRVDFGSHPALTGSTDIAIFRLFISKQKRTCLIK